MQTHKMVKISVLAMFTSLVLAACQSQSDPLKYNVGTHNRTSAALMAFDSCSDLEASLKEHFKEEMRTRLIYLKDSDYFYPYYGPVYENSAMPNAAPDADSKNESGAAPGSKEPVEGVDYSGTNNQEEGVDEADIVKTDGHYIYILNQDKLEIMGVPEFGQLTKIGSTQLEGWPQAMLIDTPADGPARAIIFSNIYSHIGLAADGPRDIIGYRYSRLKITVLNISDREKPVPERSLYLEGQLLAARKVGKTIRFVTYASVLDNGLSSWYWPDYPNELYDMDPDSINYENTVNRIINETIEKNEQAIDALTLGDFLPKMALKNGSGKWEEVPFTAEECRNFQMAQDGVGRGIDSVFTMNLLSGEPTYNINHVVANAGVIYASKNDLVIAEPAQDYWWYYGVSDYEEATNIHRFDISDPDKTVYSGSARIDGTVEDQFALSEYEGIIRVAATLGNWNRWWLNEQEVSSSTVYTLGGPAGKLEVLGSVGGIAKGERLWSARFDKNAGYLVTFRNTDPLWTIDMSNPSKPTIKGELKVPGVSTYIHPLDEGNHLLTIGYGGNNEALDWQPQISLFNIEDFSKPYLQSSLTLASEYVDGGWSWSYSEALYEHKAFQYWGPMSMLAVPLTSDYGHYEGDTYYWEVLSLLQLVKVDLQAGLSKYGAVDHSQFYRENADLYWYWGGDVRRSIFMGEYIYAISSAGVSCNRLDDMSLKARIAF